MNRIFALFLILFGGVSMAAQPQAYAVVDGSGNVVNTILWDGVSDYTPPNGDTLILVQGGAGIGWTYAHGFFSPPTAPTLTPSQQYQNALSSGLTVASTGSPAINAVYQLSPEAIQDLQAELMSLQLFQEFTNGQSSLVWTFSTPNVTLTSATQVQNLARGVAANLTSWKHYVAGVQGSAAPSSALTIP